MHEETPKAEVLNEERKLITIPKCCREGWETCKHVIKKQKKEKRNIAL